MKFIMTVRNKGEEATWTEEEDRDVKDAQTEAERIIAYFNSTLRRGEKARELVSVEVVGVGTKHTWEKDATKMSVQQPGQSGRVYDGFRCRKCGITGKRFGLSSQIQRDSKYKAKKFDVCSGQRE